MNITFINGPYHQRPYSRSSRSPAVTKSGTIYYPIWLAYAAGLASQNSHHNVALIDAVAQKINQQTLANQLSTTSDHLIVLDTSTPSIAQDLLTAQTIKQHMPHALITLVGTHATALADTLLTQNHDIDIIALGEYDQTIIDLADAIENNHSLNTVPGICFRDKKQLIHTADRPLIDNLDQFPFIAKVYQQFLNINDYFFAAARFPMVMMITSRGCPHRCKWCLYPQVMHRGKYRLRSAQNVADEFAFIADAIPSIQEIGIEDDLFTGNKKRLHDICNLLISQKNRLPFWCDTRVDLDLDSMRLLKAAGCRLLIAGFESGSQQTLDQINKNTTTEQAHSFMANARKARLLVHGCFVLGNPGETTQSIDQTIRFAQQLDPDTAQFFPMMVYPGTQMYQWAQQNNALTTENFQQWLTPDGLHNATVNLPGLPAQDIRNACDHARREFYLRQKYILKKVRQSIFSTREAKRNVKAFCRFARYLVRSA